jgi:CDGSH iron-sulfur domain-containing protein 3
MEKPKIVAKTPAVLDLEPGIYYWCSCGLSQKQPFCDGAHQGTPFVPVMFRLDKKQQVSLCQCKLTVTQPFCNGIHKKL